MQEIARFLPPLPCVAVIVVVVVIVATASCVVSPQRLDSMRDTPACAAGLWVPGGQEPAEYVACTDDAQCAKVAIPGCCEEHQVALNVEHICTGDLGSSCESICRDGTVIVPDGAELMRAACVDARCTLVR